MSKTAMRLKTRKSKPLGQIVLNVLFIAICLCYILPLMMVISISLMEAKYDTLDGVGFTIFPTTIDFTAYRFLFQDWQTILRAYGVTIAFTALHTILAVCLQAMIAYPMSRSYCRGRMLLTWYVFITMLFGAGMVPTYYIYTKYYGLGNNFWVYVLPGAVSAYNVMVVRTFYRGIPEEMIEAAKIDGANEYGVFFRMVVPLSKPCYATIAFLTLVGKWNDWNTTLIYIRGRKLNELQSLQYLLQKLLREAEEIKNMPAAFAEEFALGIPTEQVRFAMALVAAGPIIVAYPFFQKHFTRGLTVGSVKG